MTESGESGELSQNFFESLIPKWLKEKLYRIVDRVDEIYEKMNRVLENVELLGRFLMEHTLAQQKIKYEEEQKKKNEGEQ